MILNLWPNRLDWAAWLRVFVIFFSVLFAKGDFTSSA